MRRYGLLVTGFAIALTAFLVAPGAAQAGGDRDCGDFATQAAAQRFYIDAGGPQEDPHRLDADDDGIACDANPCPCSDAQGGGGGGGGEASEPAPDPVKRQRAKIVKVVDGDTVDARLLPRGPKVRVRVIGIDTPEVYGGTECGGPEASAFAKKQLPRGTRVLLVSDRTQDLKDRYGRLLRFVMKGRTDVGKLQLKKGNATVYVYDNNPFVRVKPYRSAQAGAKRADRGIWGNC